MNNLFIKFSTLSAIFLFNVILFDFFLVNAESLNFIDHSIFSPDAWINNINATKLLNSGTIGEYIVNFEEYYFSYYNVYPIILSLIYFISTDIHLIIFINSVFATGIIFKLQDILKLIYNNNFLYLPNLLVVFNPIIILSIIQPLKEILIIYLSLTLIFELIKIEKANNFLNLRHLFFLIIIILILFLFRFYQPILIIVPFILYLLVNLIYLKLDNNNKFLILSASIILLLFFLIISGFFDNFYSYINNFRLIFLNQNINGGNFLSVNLNTYDDIIFFILDFPFFLFLSIFEPILFFDYASDNFLLKLYLVFNFILSIMIVGNCFIISKINMKYFLLVFILLFSILSLSYVISNIGTLTRVKASYIIILSALGMCGWLDLIFNKFNKLKKSLLLKIKHINESLIFSIFISIFIIMLLILRDLYVIKEVNFDNSSDFFYFITFSITILAYVITNPLYEIFNKKVDEKNYYSIKNLLIDFFLISIFFSISLILLFFLVFNKNFILQDSNFIIIFSLINLPLASFVILGNVIISNKIDPILVNIGNLIVPLLCILLILFLNINIFYEIIIGLIIGQFLNFTYNLSLIITNKKTNKIFSYLINEKYYFDYKQFFNTNKISILLYLLCFSPIILSNIYFANQSISYLSYWIISSKIIFTIFFFIIGMININFLKSISLIFNFGINTDYLIYKKISIIVFNFLILISITILFLFKILVEPIIFSENLLDIFDTLSIYFLIMPFLVHSFIFIKFNTLINKSYNNFFIITLIFIIAMNILFLFFNLKIDHYIFFLFITYFCIFILINFYSNKFSLRDFFWTLLNFFIIVSVFLNDDLNLYLLLLFNIFFIFDYKFLRNE